MANLPWKSKVSGPSDEELNRVVQAHEEQRREEEEQRREEVKRLQPEFEGRMLPPVSVSLGISVYPDHGLTGEALLRAGDAALYRAKREGRNRVAAYRDMTQEESDRHLPPRRD